jgi:hypothetical protein
MHLLSFFHALMNMKEVDPPPEVIERLQREAQEKAQKHLEGVFEETKKLKIGPYEICPLPTGIFGLDGGAMFGTVPKVLWEKTNQTSKKQFYYVNGKHINGQQMEEIKTKHTKYEYTNSLLNTNTKSQSKSLSEYDEPERRNQ